MLGYVLEHLDSSKGQLKRVAEGSGVPYRTLQKIALRYTRNPRVQHVQALYDYFQRKAA